MSMILWLIWSAVMFFGNILTVMIASSYGLGAAPILWFNGIWVGLFVALQWVVPYFRQRIKNRENF